MDLEKIEGLVKILENSSLTELTLKKGDFKITMSKLTHPPIVTGGGMPFAPAQGISGAALSDSSASSDNDAVDENLYITSPIVGTFYSAPAPDAPAYVKVGDHVRAGEPVCILEAMKLMNEISCDYDCEIEAVLVSNEQKVEYGQPLFRVKKL